MTSSQPVDQFDGGRPGRRVELRIDRDSIEYHPGRPRGLVGGQETVSYDEIALVLRRDEPLPRSAVVGDDELVSKLDGDGEPLADSDENRPRRSSPGPDRPRQLDGLDRDGNSGNASDFTGGTHCTTASYAHNEKNG